MPFWTKISNRLNPFYRERLKAKEFESIRAIRGKFKPNDIRSSREILKKIIPKPVRNQIF